MSFISYAQNFEDVMLWRALKHIERGFYIDIGAQHPVVDSVSLGFYEHGWRGVHVEPTLQYSALLRAARPDESVFQLAIGNQAQKLTFYEFGDTGLSTADASVAREHQAKGFECRKTMVPILSLDALLQQAGDQDIHWLKVDVEGLEKEVLESWHDSYNLPWVVVIESTRPLTQEKCHEEWEALLFAKGYRYVYFDGLNRFYISPDHTELAEAFDSPPNIFDGFVLSGTASQPFCSLIGSKAQQAEASARFAKDKAQRAETKARAAEDKALQAGIRAEIAENRARQAEADSNQALAQLHAVYASTSWTVTKPMRVIGRLVTGESSDFVRFTMAVKLKSKLTLRPLVASGIAFISSKPALRNRLKPLIVRYPSLHQRLSRVAKNTGALDILNFPASLSQNELSPELRAMPPRARQIYQVLKVEIEKNKGAV